MARPSTFRVLLRHLPLLRPMPMVLPFMARFTGHVFIGHPERRQSGADGAGVNWAAEHYPELELRIAWNQSMFTHHGTYIIGFSAASKHIGVAPERATMIRFEPVMRERGTDFGKKVAHQPWDKPFDYELLDAFVQHQLEEKQDVTSFWRPKS